MAIAARSARRLGGDLFAILALVGCALRPVQACDVELKQVVLAAFLQSHEGSSADEVLLQDGLQQKFLMVCRGQSAAGTPADWNACLLNLRKAKQLPGRVVHRRRDSMQAYQPAAEIVARFLQDRHQTTIDRILCDPVLRTEIDDQIRQLSPKLDPYRVRKACLMVHPRSIAWLALP